MAARLKLTADRRRHRCLVLAGFESPTDTEMTTTEALAELDRMAAQIIHPADNVFRKIAAAIREGKEDGVGRIAAERLRQISNEGWTPEHDAEHIHGELAVAGVCYANEAILWNYAHADGDYPDEWPFEEAAWKPAENDPIRNLVKAGALIAAEIDRLLGENSQLSSPETQVSE